MGGFLCRNPKDAENVVGLRQHPALFLGKP